MSFTPIQSVLPRALQKLKLKAAAEAALVCEKYRQIAPREIHERALDYTFPKTLKAKTLTIGVADSAWATRVMQQKEALLKALHGTLGRAAVTSIKTCVVEKTGRLSTPTLPHE